MSGTVKRVFDVVVATLAIVLTSPVLAVVGLAVAVDSGPPVLFRQQRVGRRGAVFVMFKFRTMIGDSEADGFQTTPGDDRVTRLGELLRATSIDELPQLINVIVGDMSLVGPRPDVPQQIDAYRTEDFQKRVSVRPGITGLAQAALRSQATPSERLALDLEYVDRCNLRLDLQVIGTTISRILRGG